MDKFTLVGRTKKGEGVYFKKGDPPAIEREGMYLTDPSPDELADIYKTLSHLRPGEAILD